MNLLKTVVIWCGLFLTVFVGVSESAIVRGSSGGLTGWPTASTTKEITWANSLANAARFGDGVTPVCIYTDATLGPQVVPCTASNTSTPIMTNFNWSLKDIEGACDDETVDPDAASPFAAWKYGTASPCSLVRPVKSASFPAGSLSADGTNCANPAEVNINGGAKRWTIICLNNASSAIYGETPMPQNWDGGTVTVTASWIQTAADTAKIQSDIALACRKSGDIINNVWGTSQAATITNLGGSSKRDVVQTAAITPNGTCTGGTQANPTLLQLRYLVNVGTTTGMTTLHHTGFIIWYSETSRSQ